MAFPDVSLDVPVVGQVAYTASDATVLKIDDDVPGQSLRVFVQLGDNASFKYWAPVMSGEAYSVDWTNDDIVDAVKAFFANL